MSSAVEGVGQADASCGLDRVAKHSHPPPGQPWPWTVSERL